MSIPHTETDYVVSPGEVLAEFLATRKISKEELATRCDISVNFIKEVIFGNAELTEKVAWSFGRALDTDPQMWINLDRNYHLRNKRIDK